MKSFSKFIVEGGAFGHLSHPYDVEHFTFSDYKQIISNALSGNLEYAEEKCLDGDSIVIVDSKEIAIKDVVDNNIGNKILSYNIESNEFEECDIMNRFNNGDTEEWLLIELENGKSLKVTPSHRILTDSGFKMAIELTESDDIICF